MDLWVADTLVERIPVPAVVVWEAQLDTEKLVELLGCVDGRDVEFDGTGLHRAGEAHLAKISGLVPRPDLAPVVKRADDRAGSAVEYNQAPRPVRIDRHGLRISGYREHELGTWMNDEVFAPRFETAPQWLYSLIPYCVAEDLSHSRRLTDQALSCAKGR